jgi:hypothetical protein
VIVFYTAKYVIPKNNLGVEEEGWEIPGPNETEGCWTDLDQAKEYVRHRRHLRLVKLTDMSSLLDELVRRRELVREEIKLKREPMWGIHDDDERLVRSMQRDSAISLDQLLTDFIYIIQNEQRVS